MPKKEEKKKRIIITKYDRAQVYQFYEFPHLLGEIIIIMLIISYFWYAAGQFFMKEVKHTFNFSTARQNTMEHSCKIS